jgi:hypothetical protein
MRIIVVPSVITLAITLLRLAGERLGWSKLFFNPAPGGGFAIVGISWLPIVFGVYFGLALAKRGDGPGSAWRALGYALLGILVMFGSGAAITVMKLGPVPAILVFGVAGLVMAWVAYLGWPALGRILFGYALAARIPVAILMLFAIYGRWGTHYDVAPPNAPQVDQMAPIVKWLWIGLLPQMTIWIGFTLVVGAIFAALAAALAKPRPA